MYVKTDGSTTRTILSWNPVDDYQTSLPTLDPFELKSDRKVAPPLFPYYSETAVRDGVEVKVNGHKQRFLALDAEWKRRFAIDESLSPINIVDIAVFYNYAANRLDKQGIFPFEFPREMVVEITDNTFITASEDIDLLINYNIGADGDIDKNYAPLTRMLLGKDYFFSDVGEGYIDGYIESDKPSVLLIPNGNKDGFRKKIKATIPVGAGSFTLVDHLDRETLFDFMDLSAIVVTTPSVTAMECLAIGMPVLLVKTSDDQTGRFVEEGLAEWYSPEVLSFLLHNKAVRKSMAENGRANIKNNINNVIDIIYETWKEKCSND